MTLKHLLGAMLLLQAIAAPAQKPASSPAAPPPPLRSHEVHTDRSITFRFKDASASTVELNLEGVANPIPMTKGEDGIWSFHTQPLQPEIYFYNFVVGGEPRIDPENHRIVSNLVYPARNAVEVPGQGPQLWDVSDVPHGTVHTHTFASKIARGLPANQEEVVIYTPPGYDAHAAKPYPVLYLLHGWSGVAESWVKDQQANFILDNLLAEGKIQPMVVVMPLGYGDMTAVVEMSYNPHTELFTSILTDEIMPLVEGAYHVARNRDGRAITGSSMGGLESLDIGLHHTDRFAWIGGFSSPGQYLNYEHQLAALDPKTADLKLLWIACGTEDDLIEPNRKMIAFLKAKGMPVTQVETPGLHDSLVWRDNLIHFAQLLFQK